MENQRNTPNTANSKPTVKPTYSVPKGESQAAHNSKSKAALELLAEREDIRKWLRNTLITEIKNTIADEIHKKSWTMSNELLSYGVQLCPSVSAVWLSDQLEKSLGTLTEWLAAFAIYDGDSQANVMRAVELRQQAFKTHFPQIDEIITAQEKADETGEEQTITLGRKKREYTDPETGRKKTEIIDGEDFVIGPTTGKDTDPNQ